MDFALTGKEDHAAFVPGLACKSNHFPKIRYFLVIGVRRACGLRLCPYHSLWSVRDPVRRPFFDLLLIVLDIFRCRVLFFLAGFFALPSLSTQGSRRFISVKLKRLGIPLLLIGLFFVPLISCIGYRNRTADAHGFFRFWWMQMQTVLDWRWVNYATTRSATGMSMIFPSGICGLFRYCSSSSF